VAGGKGSKGDEGGGGGKGGKGDKANAHYTMKILLHLRTLNKEIHILVTIPAKLHYR
jgi:hypothetical protein